MKTLIFGSDHAGLSLKNFLTSVLSVEYDINIIDIGTFTNDSCDYPDYAKEVCESVLNIENSLGILICGTGIGMSIAANRKKGIRAGLANNSKIARLIRKHNDANVLVLPGRFINTSEAKKSVQAFLSTKFESGRHKRRIKKL